MMSAIAIPRGRATVEVRCYGQWRTLRLPCEVLERRVIFGRHELRVRLVDDGTEAWVSSRRVHGYRQGTEGD